MNGTAVINGIKDVIGDASVLVLPFKCSICGKIADTSERFGNYDRLYMNLYGEKSKLHICGKCLASINALDENRRWMLCLSNPAENDPCPGLALYMPFVYQGIVARAVPLIKFGKKVELARLFGCLLGSLILEEGVNADIAVPVPLSSCRFEERGFNQAAQIAYPLAKINEISFAEDLLVRTRDTKRQSEITDSYKRSSNVKGAFEVNDTWDVTGMKIILVDDVATTGATLHEAATVLYKAGASKILCTAFAGNRQIKNGEPF